MEQAGVQLIAQGSDAFGADMKTATKAVDGFGAAAQKSAGLVQDASGRWRTSTGRFASDAEKAAAGVSAITPAAKGAGDATKKAGDDAQKGGHGFDVFGQVAIGALRKVGAMAVDAFALAAKATADFLKDSVHVAGDFEQGMKKFQAVAGKGVDTKGLEQFHDLFIDLGKELPVSTSEVEQAAIEMVSGGIDPAIVAGGALRQTLNFAAASGLSLADAASTSAKFLAGWTSSAATTEEKVAFLALSTDTLTKAAAASSTTAAELRLGLFNVQGAAQALHAPFEDVTATLATLAPAFESSAQAGTSLNVFMTRLVPQTNKAEDAMNALGIITENNQNLFFDAQGGFLGMANAAQVLKDKMGGLTDEQKINQLHLLFGNDAMKVGNLLMQDGAASIDAMKAKMADANGVLATAQLMHEGYNTALENAKGSVEALQITIGEALLPVLTSLMNDYIAPAINAFTDWSDSIFKADDPLLALVTSIDQLLPGFQSFVTSAADAIGIVQDVVKTFQSASGESASLSSALGSLDTVWQQALKTVTDVGNGYMAIAQAVLPIVQKLWLDHGAQITAFLKTTYDQVIQIVTLALQLYDAIVPPILNAIAGFFTDHASAVEKVLTGMGQALGAIVTGTMDTIKGVFQLALDLIHGDWAKAWTDMQAIGQAQVTAIEGAVTGFLNMIAGIFDTSLSDIGATWQHNWETLVDIVSRIDWQQVGVSAVQGIKQGLSDSWGSLTHWLSDKASSMVNAALDAIGAHSPATAFMPVGEFSVMGIMQGFQDMWPQLTDLVAGLGGDLANQAASLARAAQNEIASGFSGGASIDRQKVRNADALQGLSKNGQLAAQIDFEDAARAAQQMTDPKQAAEYFKLRSDQIIELGKIQEQVSAATDRDEKDRLIARYQLIQDAQIKELAAQQAQRAGDGSQTSDLADSIRSLLNDPKMPAILSNPIAATLAHFLDLLTAAVPRALGGPVSAGSPYWVGEHGPELFMPRMGGMIAPAASPMQTMAGGSTTNNTSARTYNMPIYTNQSPGVLQDSMALMGAMQP